MQANGIQTDDITLSWTIRQVLRRIIEQYAWDGVRFGVLDTIL
jgi:hypothetical protein